MSLHFASPELTKLIRHIRFKQLSGCISLDHYDGGHRRYGTLQVEKGKLTGVTYFHYHGQEALDRIQKIAVLSCSFAAGVAVFQTLS